MAVETQTNRWEYEGDGALDEFAYANRIFEDSDLDVYVDGVLQVLDTDYTVTGANEAAGGNVVFVAPPDADAIIVIVRDAPATQPANYGEGDDFPAETHEQALDRATVLIQQIEARLARSIHLPDDEEDAASMELPAKAARADGVLGFDADGALTIVSGELPELAVSAFITTLLDDPDAATARATLGIDGLLLGADTAAEVYALLGVTAFMQTLLDDTTAAAARATLLVAEATVAKSANYTVVAADRGKMILADATGGSFTITLTAAATLGNDFPIVIKKVDSSANTVTIDADGSETIDGKTTLVLTQQWQGVKLRCTGGAWQIESMTLGVAAQGSVLYYASSELPVRLAVGTSGQFLSTGGAAANPAWSSSAAEFTEGYDSGSQTITAAGTLTLAHGLAGTPTLVFVTLVNLSTELGYTAGQEVDYSTAQVEAGTAADKGVSIVPDATNLNVVFGDDAATFRVLNRTNQEGAGIDATKWALRVRAFR